MANQKEKLLNEILQLNNMKINFNKRNEKNKNMINEDSALKKPRKRKTEDSEEDTISSYEEVDNFLIKNNLNGEKKNCEGK